MRLSLAACGPQPPHPCPGSGRVWDLLSPISSAFAGRRSAAVGAPTQPPSSHHPPPSAFPSTLGRDLAASALRAGAARRERPPKRPERGTELLTQGLGQSVVPGAECASGQSGLAPGDTWGLCWLSNPESGCGGICRRHLDLLKYKVSIVR